MVYSYGGIPFKMNQLGLYVYTDKSPKHDTE